MRADIALPRFEISIEDAYEAGRERSSQAPRACLYLFRHFWPKRGRPLWLSNILFLLMLLVGAQGLEPWTR